MANLKVELMDEIDGDQIEGMVIGMIGGKLWSERSEDIENGLTEDYDVVKGAAKGELLSGKEGLALLDYEYDSYSNYPQCHAVYIWTSNKIVFTAIEDKHIVVYSIPRNPIDMWPGMPGV